ncbi:putative amidohydrolase [Prauserella shujinwangii]|uniref:Putative amidohydrolase n=1 Tax=Prauserella shujinwangii TaxID=1453103 RepID=A0A2T0M3I2_9PSEU|nr:carbon-nitrogen hydrolase family protein [Prauserella shujinwangii]PRX51269.1 putative amidohydrolase [Prauserella shujinwangii]
MTRAPLTVAAAQPPGAGHAVAANAVAHADAVRAAAARVVVFPELSLTGYELDAEPVSPDDPRLAPLVDACRDTGTCALAGAPVSGDGGRPSIGMLAVDGSGAAVVYRKAWLGGAEPERFAPGPGPAVHEVGGWRLGLAICKDTGVDRHAADTAALGMDVYVAGVVEAEADTAVLARRARRVATGYGVGVVLASWAGPTGGGFDRTAGRSGIWRPGGDLAARAGREPGAVVRATLK